MKKKEPTTKTKLQYFDIIYEFGLQCSEDKVLTIDLDYKGDKFKVSGTDFTEVCQTALEWLQKRKWVGNSELVAAGLRGFARGVVKLITGSRASFHFAKPKPKAKA